MAEKNPFWKQFVIEVNLLLQAALAQSKHEIAQLKEQKRVINKNLARSKARRRDLEGLLLTVDVGKPRKKPITNTHYSHLRHAVYCAVCRECIDCNLRPCRDGGPHTPPRGQETPDPETEKNKR